ncbi:MAG: DUF1643 domain-containing protein [Sphingosinicella sp.]|nr:DUF1643 domain-containing protein [Sphingosinicella sp.]
MVGGRVDWRASGNLARSIGPPAEFRDASTDRTATIGSPGATGSASGSLATNTGRSTNLTPNPAVESGDRVTASGLFPHLNGAILSDCERYRYTLTREWNGSDPPLTFIMLNPSTADATVDDRTIRRCMGFAQARGFGGLRVVNLFAFRSTDPGNMKAESHPIGPDNNMHLRAALMTANEANAPVIAAWGADGVHRGRDAEVRALAMECGVTLMCLGVTKHRHPRHPLYIRATQRFVSLP